MGLTPTVSTITISDPAKQDFDDADADDAGAVPESEVIIEELEQIPLIHMFHRRCPWCIPCIRSWALVPIRARLLRNQVSVKWGELN
jgi:hypothetical protein